MICTKSELINMVNDSESIIKLIKSPEKEQNGNNESIYYLIII